MSKVEDDIAALVRDHSRCQKDIVRHRRELEQLAKRRDASAAEIQKLLVSSRRQEAVYDGLRYFVHNGLQIESYIGIVIVDQPQPIIEDEKE